MKVADYIINYLADYGIKDVFLVYGAANGDLVDAFTRNDDIRYMNKVVVLLLKVMLKYLVKLEWLWLQVVLVE